MIPETFVKWIERTFFFIYDKILTIGMRTTLEYKLSMFKVGYDHYAKKKKATRHIKEYLINLGSAKVVTIPNLQRMLQGNKIELSEDHIWQILSPLVFGKNKVRNFFSYPCKHPDESTCITIATELKD